MTESHDEETVRALLEPLKQVEIEPKSDLVDRVTEVAPLELRRGDAPTIMSLLTGLLASVLNLLGGLLRGGRRRSEPAEPTEGR